MPTTTASFGLGNYQYANGDGSGNQGRERIDRAIIENVAGDNRFRGDQLPARKSLGVRVVPNAKLGPRRLKTAAD